MKFRNLASLAVVLGLGAAAWAQTAPSSDAPTAVKWSAVDTAGERVAVPVADRPAAILFVRAEQPQSRQAVRQALPILQAAGKVQGVLVLSGHQDQMSAQKLAQQMQWNGPVVLDPDYAACGQMSVHVWPTTVLVNASGQQVAHLAGISNTYAKELEAYLAFASGAIDKAALTQKLAANNVIGDSNEQAASRHLQVADRLLEKGHVAEAQDELAEGLKKEPASVPLKVKMAKVLLLKGDAKGATAMVDTLDAAAVPAWQLNLLRGEAALAQGQVDAALGLLQEAVKLNPNPAEAQYQLGLAYQQKGDQQRAAEAFRAAFEATAAGKALIPAKP